MTRRNDAVRVGDDLAGVSLMVQMRRAALLATVFTLAGTPGFAAEVSDAQARVVEQQIGDWLRATVAGAVSLPDRPVRLRAEGADYAVQVPLGGVDVTGKLTPGGDGLWRLADVRVPSPSMFTVSMPMPGKAGEPPIMVPTTYQVSIGMQDVSGVFDPAYRQPSTLSQKFTNMQISAEGGGQQQTTTVASSEGTSRLTPVGDGRFDLTSDGTLQGYSIDSHLPNGTILHLAAQSGKLAMHVQGVSGERGPALLQSSIRVIAEAMSRMGGTGMAAPPVDKAALLRLVDALDGLASSVELSESLNGVQVQVGGRSGSAGAVHFGMGGAAPGGMVGAYLDVGVDQLSVPGLPGGPFADLIPKNVEVRPTLSGVSAQALVGVLRAGLQEGGAPPDFAALFAAGPVSMGIEKLAFDMGPSSFGGQGAMVFASPTRFTGAGQVVANDLDALIQRASTEPALRSAFAALTVAKGIGHTDGTRTVWDISYQGGKVLVNGVDVGAMAGMGRPPTDARPPVMQAPRPVPAMPSGKPPSK